MQLDSELQRQQLLACIRDTHITGTFQQVAEAVPVMHALVDAVQKATIVEPAQPEPVVIDGVEYHSGQDGPHLQPNGKPRG